MGGNLALQAVEKGYEVVSEVPSYIEDTGEVNWLINDAMHMEVSVPVISQAVMQLNASRDNQHVAFRAIAMMRQGLVVIPWVKMKLSKTNVQMEKLVAFENK